MSDTTTTRRGVPALLACKRRSPELFAALVAGLTPESRQRLALRLARQEREDRAQRLDAARAIAARPARVRRANGDLNLTTLEDGSTWTLDGRLMRPPDAYNTAEVRRREVGR